VVLLKLFSSWIWNICFWQPTVNLLSSHWIIWTVYCSNEMYLKIRSKLIDDWCRA
jgi:hypothetical protein